MTHKIQHNTSLHQQSKTTSTIHHQINWFPFDSMDKWKHSKWTLIIAYRNTWNMIHYISGQRGRTDNWYFFPFTIRLFFRRSLFLWHTITPAISASNVGWHWFGIYRCEWMSKPTQWHGIFMSVLKDCHECTVVHSQKCWHN